MKTFALLIGCLLLNGVAACQEFYSTYNQNYRTHYLRESSEYLPELFKKSAYDSIVVYINALPPAIKDAPYVFATKLLAGIQLKTFSIKALPGPQFLDTLTIYAYDVRRSQQMTLPVSDEPGRRLEDIPYTDRLFMFDAIWARMLLRGQQLDSTQAFICNAIAGNIERPLEVIYKNRAVYPYLDSLLTQRQIAIRAGWRPNGAYGAGVWMPQGNAGNLGAHPTLGLSFGVRNKYNQYDISISGRLGRTPHDYTVWRSDSLYSRHQFFGGYIGFDYTRYFYHSLHFETGIIAGIGYDSFDIASSGDDNNDYSNDYLKPFEIGSLNLNTGLRMNYFVNMRNYLGLEARFNYMRYKNSGGTPLDGNAFSVMLVFGHN